MEGGGGREEGRGKKGEGWGRVVAAGGSGPRLGILVPSKALTYLCFGALRGGHRNNVSEFTRLKLETEALGSEVGRRACAQPNLWVDIGRDGWLGGTALWLSMG